MQIISLHCNLATVQTDQAVNFIEVFAAGPKRAADSDATSAGQFLTISQAFFICSDEKMPAAKKIQLPNQAGEKVADATNRDDGVQIRTPRSDSETDDALSTDYKCCNFRR